MKHVIFYLGIVLMLVSCDSERDQRMPDHVLNKERMAALLADIHLVEGALSRSGMQADSARMYAVAYYREVLNRHDVTPAMFRQSMDFYMDNPDIMLEMYDPIMEDISSRKIEEKEQEKPALEAGEEKKDLPDSMRTND